MTYKYHYVIKNKYGEVIDTAQDNLMKDIMLNWLCEYHGIEYARTLSVEKKRISKEAWKERYC